MKKLLIVLSVLILGGVLFFTGCQQTAVTSAKVYMQQNNYDKAIEQCKVAIAQVPNDPDAYFILGQSYGEKGMYSEMIDALNKTVSINPKYSPQVQEYKTKYFTQLFNNGVGLIKQGKYDQAAENYRLCIAIFPQKTDSYKNLGYVYTQLKNDSAAIDTYKKAALVDSTDMEVQSSLGVLYYRNKQYDKAVTALKTVLAKAKSDSKQYMDALFYTAYSYDLLQQGDKAIELYSNALKLNPDNKDLLFNVGRLYLVKADYPNAVDRFRKVVTLDPNDFDANFNSGFCLFQLKKHEESLPYLKKSVEVKPDNTSAWAALVVALDQAGRKDSESYLLIGRGLLQLQKPKEAVPYLKKSVDLKADSIPAWEKLVEALNQAELPKEAKDAQKKLDALKGGK